jgi:predicted metalloprotease
MRPWLLGGLGTLLMWSNGLTVAPAEAAWNRATLDFVIERLNEFWGSYFWRSQRVFVPPIAIVHAGVRPTPCGPSQIAHYCAQNNTIHLNRVALTNLALKVGDAAAYFAVAHEYGHAVQAHLGLLKNKVPLVKLELQADCLAGAFFAASRRAGVLERGDYEEALKTAFITGDRNIGHANHHGTPQQRQQAFHKGFINPKTCF